VDGVSARVYQRYFGLPASAGVPALRALVERVTPRAAAREWNWAVLDLAAMICVPRNPRCEVCPLVRGCAAAGTISGPVPSGG
jgi:A/G-specific adenine glycosylase